MNRVKQLVDEHGPAMAEDVREILGREPTRKVVGLIVDEKAPEAPSVMAAIAQQGGRGAFPGGGWCVIERTSAVDMLKAIAPHGLEWLEPSTVDCLPIVVVLEGGTQLAAMPI